jgi:hypothetical protein
MAFGGQPLRNPKHHWRFACAAHRQVADTDYGTLKTPAAQEPVFIEGRSQAHQTAIKQA